MDALRQDGILGTLFFITGYIFALLVPLEDLGSRPQQQNSPTRITQSVAGNGWQGKILLLENFPNK